MRIGVVCEGPTDFYAIAYFFGRSLENVGIETEFVPIQPEMDKTQPEAGWGHVLLWLNKNPPAKRVQQYFKGGLFAGQLGVEELDGLLIQLDSDILEDKSFQTFVQRNYQYNYGAANDPDARSAIVRDILQVSAKFSEMTNADISRHVLAPAVESTETWCLAAFENLPQNFELLSSEQLRNGFMRALETSEGRAPAAQYGNIDKCPKRRRNFCEGHAGGFGRVINGCQRFSEIYGQLVSLA